MSKTLLGISQDYAYLHNTPPVKLSDVHSPYFLVFTGNENDIETARKKLIEDIEKRIDENLSKIERVGEIIEYRSFWDFDLKRKVFPVYTKKSFFVPDVSDHLFFNYGLYTAEHDIPYHQRALVDLASKNIAWMFDTEGKNKRLKTLVYDIEIIKYEEGRLDVPIDIIGYSSFDITINSRKNLWEEDFDFKILDIPRDLKSIEIKQLVSRDKNEELENLLRFCKTIMEHDIISGHNIVGFDNLHLHGRVKAFIKEFGESLEKDELKLFQEFVEKYTRVDSSFHFGVGSEVLNIYPCSFDTYLATRKFYPYVDDFSLKTVAQFLGIDIKDRIYLMPSQIKLDERTLKYNMQDVEEQLGLTINMIEQAMPLSFITCMPFDSLLEAGAVNMWDHMAMIRASLHKKIMPPTCKPLNVCKSLARDFNELHDKVRIADYARKIKERLSKEFIRVVKYGPEMPDWVEYPYVIFNKDAKDTDEVLNYHLPGGMTIKPDKDARSHFIPWYYVIVADVGAMYPTILKALNIGGDVVRLARKDEKPDLWIWLKKIPRRFLESKNILWREVGTDESFADKGVMIGIKIDRKPGVVNLAMTGIMDFIARIKKELKEAKNEEEKKRLQMSYQSLKGARNAGTHGILSAPTVSGRQFNLWGAAAITTMGQKILSDTLHHLKEKKARVVYGDTDGIYLGCSRSVGNVPELCRVLNLDVKEKEDTWIIKPDEAMGAIKECNEKWKKELNYPGFELEPEVHHAMLFVKHKNYLIFDALDGKLKLVTKGNNFKGSEKANIARKTLEKIMYNVLREVYEWEEEEEARKKIIESIKNATAEVVKNLDLSKVNIEDLILVQSVQPARRYKPNMDGSPSVFAVRAMALEKLLGQPLHTRTKFKFVVTKKPLPGITKPSKSGVKPIDYMYPVDAVKDLDEIDLEWYKKMIENFIEGAFGLSGVKSTVQKGLDAWM
ncbi:DNA polymerase elongation subunit (family B) [Euryarchaeota archaeon ex4484_162]|nr:MAG: DNA polymerase elongation subunit (family B) [Euryarchaeota archaeon ex4484_162]